MRPTVSSEVMKNRTKQLALVVIRLCQGTTTRSGSAHYQPPTSTLGNLSGSELSLCLPGSLYRRLHLPARPVLEEADEMLFWLELLVDAGIARLEQINLPLDEAHQLVSIFVASLRTVKSLKSEI